MLKTVKRSGSYEHYLLIFRVIVEYCKSSASHIKCLVNIEVRSGRGLIELNCDFVFDASLNI